MTTTSTSQAQDSPESLVPLSRAGAPRKILIADDSPTFRELERQLLKLQGYELLTASNGVEAVRMALKDAPDLVLLDLQMPIMTGDKALAILKNHERTCKIPVVIVTTQDSVAEQSRLRQAGADAFLGKPISAPQLAWLVNSLIGETGRPSRK